MKELTQNAVAKVRATMINSMADANEVSPNTFNHTDVPTSKILHQIKYEARRRPAAIETVVW